MYTGSQNTNASYEQPYQHVFSIFILCGLKASIQNVFCDHVCICQTLFETKSLGEGQDRVLDGGRVLSMQLRGKY